MKEFVEKLIGRLEELGWVFADYYPDGTAINRKRKKSVAYDDVISIVNQLAEEYNNGWIPCSERLPEKNQRCLIQYNGSMSGNNDYIDVDTYNGERFEFFGIIGVIAWQPLPAPYKKGE